MLITQKTRYGLRAVFELAKHMGEAPMKIGEIAQVQAIPPRFLEAILRDLKQAGIVASRRGSQGGYALVRSPQELTVLDVIEVLQGPVNPMACTPGDGVGDTVCEFYGSCAFLSMWQEMRDAIRHIYEKTSFQGLVEKDQQQEKSGHYII